MKVSENCGSISWANKRGTTPIPDHAVLQARPAWLQHEHGFHQQVQGEREAALDQTNTTCVISLYFLSVHLYFLVMMLSCLFTIVFQL